MEFKGSYVALVTPFNQDGSVNFTVLGNLIDLHLESKTEGLVILGTTAEAPTLTYEEEEEIVRFTVNRVNKRKPIIVGSGSNSTDTAITYSKKYEQMGADALLVITPYYNKTNERGMIHHFTNVADAVNIPVILYNVPSRTGCSLSINALKVLKNHKNIAGIKEASGDFSFVAKVAELCDENFVMLSGNDDQIVPLMSLGGSGVISVWANIMPNTVHDLCQAMIEHNYEYARKLQLKYLDVCNHLFIETNPIPVKEAMNFLGYNVGPCRLPLDEMDPKNKEILHNTISKIRGVL